MNKSYRALIASFVALLLTVATSAAVAAPTTKFKNNVRVTGNLTIDGTQTLTGNTAIAGNTTIAGTLAVTGATTVGGSSVLTNGSVNAVTGIKTFAEGTNLSTMGTGAQTYSPSGVLSAQVNQFSTAVGTGAQVGHTFTLPANSLVTSGRGFHIRAWGVTAANGNNKTVTIKFGANTYTTGVLAANAKDYYIDVLVVRTGLSAQTWMASGYANAALLSNAGSATRGTLTQTETGAIVISTELTDGTSSAGDIVENGFEVTAL